MPHCRSGCRLFWSNARQQRGRLQNGYVVEVIDSENSNSAIEGYMYFRQERVDGGGLEATIHVQVCAQMWSCDCR